jgi:hypothetical protein
MIENDTIALSLSQELQENITNPLCGEFKPPHYYAYFMYTRQLPCFTSLDDHKATVFTMKEPDTILSLPCKLFIITLYIMLVPPFNWQQLALTFTIPCKQLAPLTHYEVTFSSKRNETKEHIRYAFECLLNPVALIPNDTQIKEDGEYYSIETIKPLEYYTVTLYKEPIQQLIKDPFMKCLY